MTRLKASGIHLLLSVLIAIVMLYLVFGLWYPGQYYKLLEVDSLYLILMGVDVTLGPLLTLAVYKAGKRGLKFDLAVIGIVQMCALLYGAYVVFQTRPVFNVFEGDRFKVGSAIEYSEKLLKSAPKEEWRKLSLLGPVLVAAIPPLDSKLKDEVVTAGGEYYNFPKIFVDYDSRRKEVLKNAKSLSRLKGLSTEYDATLSEFLAKNGRPESDFVWLPIVYSYSKAMTLILDARNADVIGMVDINPP